MNDITLELTPGRKLTTLQVVAEFPNYSEILQRAVMLILTADNPNLYVSGKPVVETLLESNASAINMMRGEFQILSNELKVILNSEAVEVDELSITPEVTGASVKIAINIITVDGQEAVTELVV